MFSSKTATHARQKTLTCPRCHKATDTKSQVSFTPVPQQWISPTSTAQVRLNGLSAPIKCGNFFTFNSSVLSQYDSNTDTKGKLFVLIAVESLHSSPNVWEPLPVTLAPVTDKSVFTFALSTDALPLHQNVRIKKVTVLVESLDPFPPTVLTAIQQLRINALLATIDDPNLCDCSLLPKNSNAKPIFVSRAVLAHASHFFATMFNGPWADSVKQDKSIDFGWNVSAVIPGLIHIYSGWVPGQPLPLGKAVKDLLAKHALDINALTLHQWLELMDLAQMLELPLLVQAVNKEMAKALKAQLVKVSDEMTELCKNVKAIEIGAEAEE